MSKYDREELAKYKEARDLWINALRRGDYVQTYTGSLQCAEKVFSCLGVACDVIDTQVQTGSDGFLFGEILSNEQEFVFDRLGLSKKGEDILIDLNQRQNYSFEDIADELENNLPVFFKLDTLTMTEQLSRKRYAILREPRGLEVVPTMTNRDLDIREAMETVEYMNENPGLDGSHYYVCQDLAAGQNPTKYRVREN